MTREGMVIDDPAVAVTQARLEPRASHYVLTQLSDATPTQVQLEAGAEPMSLEAVGQEQVLAAGQDMGVQQITITVFGFNVLQEEPDRFLLRTIGYKIDRSLAITGYEVKG